MNRCKKLLDELKARKGVGAAVVHRPENIQWLTGYTGEGCVVLCEEQYTILTDFRYTEAAGRQAPECACLMTGNGVSEASLVAQLCEQFDIREMAAEPDYLTYTQYTALEQALPKTKLVPLDELPQEMRMIKDESEIECIRRAAAISCQAFANLLEFVKPGMTEKQVQVALDYEMLKLGGDVLAFSTISAAGMNGSLPHAVPSDHVIQNGELLTLDFGARVGGYCSDMTRTIGFGHIGAELREMYQRVLDAQRMALDAVRPGAVCGDIDKIARDFLDARYPGRFGHSLGHGVGLFIHENPRVGKGSTPVLKPGHVVTVEPGVYIPGLGGCRIEDMTIITRDGYIDPITAPKELIEL